MIQPLPPDLEAALATSGLSAFFASYPPSHRSEYLRWIDEAKRPQTRESRIAKTIAALLARAPGRTG